MSEQCSKCGYDLAGLSMRGQCPECGSRYDLHSRMGVGRGPSSSTRGARLIRQIVAIGLTVLALGVLSLGFYIKYTYQRENAAGVGLIIGIMLLLGAGIAYLGMPDKE